MSKVVNNLELDKDLADLKIREEKEELYREIDKFKQIDPNILYQIDFTKEIYNTIYEKNGGLNNFIINRITLPVQKKKLKQNLDDMPELV